MRRYLLASVFVGVAALAAPAVAYAPPPIRESVALCDPNTSGPTCAKINSDGSLTITGSGGTTSSPSIVGGSANTPFTQGTGAAGASSLNVATTPATGSVQSVSNAGTFAVQNTAALPAGTNIVGGLVNYLGFDDVNTNTALAASTPYTSTSRSLSGLSNMVSFGVSVENFIASPGAVLSIVQGSSQRANVSIAAGGNFDVEIPLRGTGAVSFSISNGSVAQTGYQAHSSLRAVSK